ncbi:MAG: YbbR-like domain-containing protein [Gemmatimonadetes bacterium]|jgi:hypothetical protein|nr:YbbR-like domain-containing protein [Gemmatimonadota bacterium]MBT7861956.1 YbbR-like domain-containing protein [Gemmatimonadota bacterium]
MRQWLTGDWGVKLGALLLASGLWLHAVTEHSYRREVDIRLLVDDPATAGEPALVVASEIPARARVAIFGHGKDLLRLNPSDLLLHLQPGIGASGSVTLRPLPAHVEDHSELALTVEAVLDPRELTFALDTYQTRRVPLQSAANLKAADSFTIVGPLQLKPDSVTISGPRALVNAVEFVRTDTFAMSGLSAPLKTDVQLQMPATTLLRLSRTTTILVADVQELAEYEIAGVPVRVQGRHNAVATPSRVTVKVRGGADLIGSLDPETDLGLYVHAEAAESGGAAAQLVLSPQGRLYELLEITPARVDIVER